MKYTHKKQIQGCILAACLLLGMNGCGLSHNVEESTPFEESTNPNTSEAETLSSTHTETAQTTQEGNTAESTEETTAEETEETTVEESTEPPFDWNSFVPVKSTNGSYVSGYPETEKNVYSMYIDMTSLDFSPTTNVNYDQNLGEYQTVRIQEKITFTNISKTARNEICLRDYGQAWADNAAATYGTSYPHSQFTNMVDLRNNEVLNVRTDGSSVVYVTLTQPLEVGERMTLSFSYELPVCRNYSQGERTHFDYAYDAQGVAYPYCELGSFYPMLAAWTDDGWDTDLPFPSGECVFSPVSDYAVAVYAPEGCSIISTGNEVLNQTENGISVWDINVGSVRDFYLVACAGYQMQEENVDGITVRAYSYPIDGFCESFLAQARDSIRAYTQMYGTYPYSTLDIVESSVFSSMESPQLILIARPQWWIGSGENAPYCAVAHELAHQWFYGVVGNDQYQEAWLDEGFANFSECIYYEYVNGFFDWDNKILEYHQNYDAMLGNTPIDVSYNQIQYYTATVYHKGANFLMELRRCMGAETFQAMMREYYAKYFLKVSTTKEFVATLKPYIADNEAAKELCRQYLSQWTE